ncbi:dihydrofolate reductase [Blastopirellula sp. JC732]|uniref:Dihydrofolate reductase n=1 Tax=Blastopirellula sediminis TaxID=2894196 RepID=A0A9X1MP99_9BACT|nr:dihydrofolate reductase [Blastopirellula sediminis]MCC9606839.1 dihydrofolate reductase [Blastopirellula sediminis]MCC9629865.1 dihydrofolate reductase [Blastopirellula sediminis]
MTVSLIVAASENGVIGRNGDMPWRLSSDLQRFKKLTMGNTIVMGRKTYESIGRLLPGRQTVIVTRQADYAVEGAVITSSVEEAVQVPSAGGELFIVGGGEIYAQSIDLAQQIYLTRVHALIDDGDAFFPALDRENWERVEATEIGADEKNDYPTTFEIWRRI